MFMYSRNARKTQTSDFYRKCTYLYGVDFNLDQSIFIEIIKNKRKPFDFAEGLLAVTVLSDHCLKCLARIQQTVIL